MITNLQLSSPIPAFQATISVTEAIAVIGCIILALKHPGNNGPTAGMARGVAQRLAQKIQKQGLRLPDDIREEWSRDLGISL